MHRGADIDISCTFAVLHGGISVATTILNHMLHNMATMLFGYHNLFSAMLEIGSKNLPETMKAVEQHSEYGMKSMLDKPVKIDTTVGKFKKESMHVFTLFQAVEKRLQSNDSQMLAKNTSQLMLMRKYYKRLLQSLHIYSVLSHNDKTDDYWQAFISDNRNVWRMVHYLMPQMVCLVLKTKKIMFFFLSTSLVS